MKRLFAFIFLVIILPFEAMAQIKNRKSKSELTGLMERHQIQMDSLIIVNEELRQSANSMQLALENQLIENDRMAQKVSSMQATILKRGKSLDSLATKIALARDSIAVLTLLKGRNQELNSKISSLEDLIKDGGYANESAGIDQSDFLNRYFLAPFPLEDIHFQLVLEKIIAFDSHSKRDYYDESRGSLYSELLTFNDLSFYSNGNSLLSADLNAMFPKMEVLRNKLMTIRFSDNSSSNFLMNVVAGNGNNGRVTKVFEFTPENTGNDNNYRYNNDVIKWPLIAIGNDCYFALSEGHLNQLKVGVNMDQNYHYNRRDDENRILHHIQLYRRKDAFMLNHHNLNSTSIIYLFKLREV